MITGISRISVFALAPLFAAATTAYGERFEENTPSDATPELNTDDLSTVGDGIPSTGEQRSALLYGDEGGCTEGTELELVPEEGGSPQTVWGVKAEDNGKNPIVIYKGIPYAAPPVGDLRWRDPAPSELKEVRAVEYGPSCLQPQKDKTYDLAQVSEDCLDLNVWSPSEAAAGKKKVPVLVFIHGGAFLTGSGGEAKGDTTGNLNLYDGRQLLATAHKYEEDLVFVALNYRLGARGFLAGDEYGLEGHYGIKDQTKALEWVKRNIARFGGDPERVTIFGESAGAQSVALHLAIEENDHQSLFSQAAIQSDYTMGYMSLGEAQKRADNFSRKLGCAAEEDPVACLRSVEASAILEAGIPAALSARLLACEGWNAALP